MKNAKVHMPNISYIAAYVIGVILFAVFWKTLMGTASSMVVLVGMVGVAVAEAVFWLRNENQHHIKKDE